MRTILGLHDQFLCTQLILAEYKVLFAIISNPPGGSGWIIGVGQVRWIIHLVLRGVATPGAWYARATVRVDETFFFRAHCTSFHIHSSLLTFFLSFFVFYHYCCSHAQVFGKNSCISSTFPIAILSGTCFFRIRNIPCFSRASPIKN